MTTKKFVRNVKSTTFSESVCEVTRYFLSLKSVMGDLDELPQTDKKILWARRLCPLQPWQQSAPRFE